MNLKTNRHHSKGRINMSKPNHWFRKNKNKIWLQKYLILQMINNQKDRPFQSPINQKLNLLKAILNLWWLECLYLRWLWRFIFVYHFQVAMTIIVVEVPIITTITITVEAMEALVYQIRIVMISKTIIKMITQGIEMEILMFPMLLNDRSIHHIFI